MKLKMCIASLLRRRCSTRAKLMLYSCYRRGAFKKYVSPKFPLFAPSERRKLNVLYRMSVKKVSTGKEFVI